MFLFGWLIDVDGDLASINPTEPFLREEFSEDQREDSKENLKITHKLTIIVQKPVSIKDTPLLQHHNLVFNLQDNLSHKKFEDSTTMVEGESIQTLKNP